MNKIILSVVVENKLDNQVEIVIYNKLGDKVGTQISNQVDEEDNEMCGPM